MSELSVPSYLHHLTASRNRQSIYRQGLLPRQTADHHYPSYPQQPTGVYGSPPAAPLFYHKLIGEEPIDIWRVYTDRLAVIADPELGANRGFVIVDPVPPSSIELSQRGILGHADLCEAEARLGVRAVI